MTGPTAWEDLGDGWGGDRSRDGLLRLRPAELRAYHRFLRHGCPRRRRALEEGGLDPAPPTAVTFTPTAIGTQVALRCGCGRAEDITDYDSW